MLRYDICLLQQYIQAILTGSMYDNVVIIREPRYRCPPQIGPVDFSAMWATKAEKRERERVAGVHEGGLLPLVDRC